MPVVTRFQPNGDFAFGIDCDDCGRAISPASDGVVLWRPGDDFGEPRPVLLVHRDCALAVELREGGAFCSDELLWFPTRLGQALGATRRQLEPATLPHRDMLEG